MSTLYPKGHKQGTSRKGKKKNRLGSRIVSLILTLALVFEGAFLLYKNQTAKQAEAAGEGWLTDYAYRKAPKESPCGDPTGQAPERRFQYSRADPADVLGFKWEVEERWKE